MRTVQEILFTPGLNLENERVIMRVVSMDDLAALRKIAFDAGIWKYFTSEISNEEDLIENITGCLSDFANKQRVPFVIIEKDSGEIVGMSSLGNISVPDKRIEIGWSWLSTAVQGSGVNQSYKMMLMDFVFQQLRFVRLEFKTDVLNLKARKALLKIGTTEEGILRSHTQMHHDRRRDTIYYSILHDEWKLLRNQL